MIDRSRRNICVYAEDVDLCEYSIDELILHLRNVRDQFLDGNTTVSVVGMNICVTLHASDTERNLRVATSLDHEKSVQAGRDRSWQKMKRKYAKARK